MRNLKNKKGFTLVELLAVIVILALVMAIAIYSISGVLTSSRQSVFKENAAGIIRGVKMQLIAANRLESGRYYFTTAMLESGGTNPPFGGVNDKYKLFEPTSTDTPVSGTTGIYKTNTTGTCNDEATSYVEISVTPSGGSESKICLTAGKGYRYIKDAKESDLLGSGTTMIVDPNATSTGN